MWFAGLGDLQQNHWLYIFCGKLLLNSQDAFALLAPRTDGKDHTAPKSIRVLSYDYVFSNITETTKWWEKRIRTRKVYIEPMSLGDKRTPEGLSSLGTNLTLDRSEPVSCRTSLVCINDRAPVAASLASGGMVLWLLAGILNRPKVTKKNIHPSELQHPTRAPPAPTRTPLMKEEEEEEETSSADAEPEAEREL